MRFKDAEFKKLIKLEGQSPIIEQLKQIDDNSFSAESPDRLKKLTKEVLKACNVIRPDMNDLYTLPLARQHVAERMTVKPGSMQDREADSSFQESRESKTRLQKTQIRSQMPSKVRIRQVASRTKVHNTAEK